MARESRDPERLFSHFARSMPMRAWIKDPDGKYVYVNSHLVADFGIPQETWLGSTDEILLPRFARVYRRNDLAVLSSGQPLQTTELVERLGETEFEFVLRFPLDIDEVRHVGAVATNLTQEVSALIGLRNVHEQLFRSERLRAVGEMTSGLAHDVNNSLNAAALRLQTMRAAASPELLSHVDALGRSIATAAERVKAVQEFVRAGRDEQLQSVDLVEVIGAAVEMIDFVVQKSPTVLGGRVKIDCRIRRPLPRVNGLPTDLKHVFANLFLNSRDAMLEGGTIAVDAKVAQSTLEIAVSDEGTGIAPNVMSKIFTPFFTTKPTGSGLGLSMARDVMTRIGGQISGENRPAGGAVFRLIFPLPESR
jgi:signal transduction histidine kinase